jgi:YHS domain-containing protein
LSIIFSGIFFGAYSVINDISLPVFKTSVPGIVFGMLVAYMGIRYYFMVSDFKIEFLKNDAKFSWSNFKKEKKKVRVTKNKLIIGR